jgi:hypothetical protein
MIQTACREERSVPKGSRLVTFFWAAAAFAAPLGISAACSSTGSSVGATCGPGTFLQSGQCLPVAFDGGVDAPLDTGTPMADATTEGGYDAEANAEASSTADVVFDDGVSDASEAGDQVASDPCPPSAFYDCDPVCCAAHPGCQPNNCLPIECPNPQALLPAESKFVIRTPDHPGANAQCVAACPQDGFVYGIGFTIDSLSSIRTALVSVEPPWEVVEVYPASYCTNSRSIVAQPGCSPLPIGVGSAINIVTRDPNASGRNITFELSTNPQAHARTAGSRDGCRHPAARRLHSHGPE